CLVGSLLVCRERPQALSPGERCFVQVLADLVARSVRAFRKVENLRLERKMLRAFLLVRSFKREAHRPEAQLLLSTAKGLYRALGATAGQVWAGDGASLRCVQSFGPASAGALEVEGLRRHLGRDRFLVATQASDPRLSSLVQALGGEAVEGQAVVLALQG